jgi:hypothetical protein
MAKVVCALCDDPVGGYPQCYPQCGGELPMNTKSLTAKMLSRFKESLDSWISIWHFLANLHDLAFYQGLEDPQREICLGLLDGGASPRRRSSRAGL